MNMKNEPGPKDELGRNSRRKFMTALGAAFAAIESGAASDYTISDGYREYSFDGFSIIVGPEIGKNPDTTIE